MPEHPLKAISPAGIAPMGGRISLQVDPNGGMITERGPRPPRIGPPPPLAPAPAGTRRCLRARGDTIRPVPARESSIAPDHRRRPTGRRSENQMVQHLAARLVVPG